MPGLSMMVTLALLKGYGWYLILSQPLKSSVMNSPTAGYASYSSVTKILSAPGVMLPDLVVAFLAFSLVTSVLYLIFLFNGKSLAQGSGMSSSVVFLLSSLSLS